jgi:glycine/D-amino acid oxidase-like deaminating enzyme
MNRRTAIKTGGAALVGLGLGGCASVSGLRSSRLRVNLAPIEASWERVIRTTVGLRPHRPRGFLLKGEKLGDKLLIHNYGHGGAGHSLGWGTGAMAADIALQQPARRAAVIGCGTVGLTTARQLQRRGFAVTIYTRDVPPYTTSNMSLAAFTPTSGLISEERAPEWDAQFRQAVEISYRELQLLAGPRYGVSWIDNYTMTDTPPGPRQQSNTSGSGARQDSNTSGLLPAHIQTSERIVLGPGEHPFPTKYAMRRSTLRIEPSWYLDALVADVLRFGGRIVVRMFDAPADLMTLTEPVVVNCTGLGSRELFADQTMLPVKGQLSVLIPQPEVNYEASGGGDRFGGGRISAMPRSDGIAIGNTMERNVWTLEPNEEARQRNVGTAIAVFAAMRGLDPKQPLTRAAPPAQAPNVESFFDPELG